MGKYLDILQCAVVQREGGDISDQSDKSRDFRRFCRFGRRPEPYCQAAFEALERRRPAYVEHDQWQQAIADGRRFLTQWGEKSRALRWTARDLFGLSPISNKPAPSYRRLSRYDETGLIWLLGSRPVVMLTERTAAIESPTGAITIFRKNNKPALGSVATAWTTSISNGGSND